MTSTIVKYPEGPVVILGASYAQGWDLSVGGVSIVNKGVSGQQAFELLARFDQDVVEAKPRAVILWGFINDIFRSPPEQLDAAKIRARDSIARMVDKAREHGIEPVLATEVTVRPRDSTWSDWFRSRLGSLLGRQSYQDIINIHVLEINQWLREYAQREQLLVLDLQPVVSDQDGRRRKEFAQDDGSHISHAGYEALTVYALPLLRRHLGIPVS